MGSQPRRRLFCLIIFHLATTAMAVISTRFILTYTHHPGNVGAAARALKVMDFDDLWLVRPDDPKVLGRKRCRDGASGAVQVIRQAKIVDTLEEAIQGISLVCGTGMPIDMHTARPKREHPRILDYFEPRPYLNDLIRQTDPKIESIAFVFGNERRGMTIEDIDLCDCMLGIPTNPSFGSLNLASAVQLSQLIAYDWRQALGGFPKQHDINP